MATSEPTSDDSTDLDFDFSVDIDPEPFALHTETAFQRDLLYAVARLKGHECEETVWPPIEAAENSGRSTEVASRHGASDPILSECVN